VVRISGNEIFGAAGEREREKLLRTGRAKVAQSRVRPDLCVNGFEEGGHFEDMGGLEVETRLGKWIWVVCFVSSVAGSLGEASCGKSTLGDYQNVGSDMLAFLWLWLLGVAQQAGKI
jgi:hypothetical protein